MKETYRRSHSRKGTKGVTGHKMTFDNQKTNKVKHTDNREIRRKLAEYVKLNNSDRFYTNYFYDMDEFDTKDLSSEQYRALDIEKTKIFNKMSEITSSKKRIREKMYNLIGNKNETKKILTRSVVLRKTDRLHDDYPEFKRLRFITT